MAWFRLPSCLQPPYRQDGPWSWVVLVAVGLHASVTHGFSRCFGVFLPVLMEEFNETRGRVALVGSLAVGISLLMSVATGWLCTRLDVRIVSVIGHIIRCLSLVTTSLLPSLIPMYFIYSMGFGIAVSFIFMPAMFSLIRYFKRRRSLAMGVLSAGGGLGVMTLPPLIQYFIDIYGWRNSFRLLVSFYAFSILFVFVYRPEVLPEEAEKDKDANHQHKEKVTEEKTTKETTKRKSFDCSLWTRSQFQVVLLSICMASFGLFNAPFHLVKFAGEIGISATKASILYTLMGGASVVSRLVSGRLCENIKATYISICCQFLSAVLLFLLPQAYSYLHLIIYSLVSGFLDGAFCTTMAILYSESGGSHDKAAMAYSQGVTVTSLFQASGPAVAGVMADRSGSYRTAFYMSGAVLLAGSAVQFIPLCLKLCKGCAQCSESKRASEIELEITECLSEVETLSLPNGRKDTRRNEQERDIVNWISSV